VGWAGDGRFVVLVGERINFFPTAEESGVMKIEEDAREISLRRSVGGAF
jgi:hypothetical protein